MPQDVEMARSTNGCKRDLIIHGVEVYQWLLVMMAEWNHHVQRLYVSGYQLLRRATWGRLLSSLPACVASQDHLVGHHVMQDAGQERSSLVRSSKVLRMSLMLQVYVIYLGMLLIAIMQVLY